MSREGHPPHRAASAYSKSRDGAEQSLPTEPPQGALSSGQTAGQQVYLKNTVRVLDPFHNIAFIEMFFERYTKERVQKVTMRKGEAFVTFLEARGAEKALGVPKIMVGQPINVYAVDPSEQHSQSILMQAEDKASFEKVCCESCKKYFDKADMVPLGCRHHGPCRGCSREWDRTCSYCDVITVYCDMCTNAFDKVDTMPLACNHQRVCRECSGKWDCMCSSCRLITVRCVNCKTAFGKADTEPLICGHQSVCRACNSTRDCSKCTTCGKNTVHCVICKKGFTEAETDPLICGHRSVCLACNSTRDCSTCTTCGKNTVRCDICKKGFEEAYTKPLVCGHQSVCHGCNYNQDFLTCSTCGKNTVCCVTCKNYFDEADTELLVCGHQTACLACNSTRDCITCTSCGENTGKSLFGEIEVNPNQKQTDKRYQQLESSEYTFEPDQELRGTDKDPHERPSGYKVKATHVRNINVREKSDKMVCDVTGLVVISHDIMVVCDCNNSSVKLIDTKQNTVTSQIRLPSKPWDTALVPRDVTEEPTTYDLIVTLPRASKLRYVQVTGDQITDTDKVISVEGWCRGIQVTQDRKLAVSYGGPGKVEILDMDGQVLRRLQTDHDGARLFHAPWHLAVSPDTGILYVSAFWNNKLTSISTRDWSVMTRLEGLNSPRGVTVDRAGSVFVCCDDRTVHLVAATGDRSAQILGKKDGLCESPQAIGLSPEGNRMYVSGWESDHVQEFQLTEN